MIVSVLTWFRSIRHVHAVIVVVRFFCGHVHMMIVVVSFLSGHVHMMIVVMSFLSGHIHVMIMSFLSRAHVDVMVTVRFFGCSHVIHVTVIMISAGFFSGCHAHIAMIVTTVITHIHAERYAKQD